MNAPFDVGCKVRCRNIEWEVLSVSNNNDGTFTIRLYPDSGGRPQGFIYPYTNMEPIQSGVSAERIGHIDHYHLFTYATLLSLVYEYDKLLSISNSTMIPEPYQLIAVKKVMESLRQRFLIADDVGLGKTIEAGLIMQELTARGRGARILIICPASLQDQWKKEMKRHFHRNFFIYNSRKMEGIQELVDENLNPWLAKDSIITSIDWIKPQYEGSGLSQKNSNKVFDKLTSTEKLWDLMIIDEAHYVSTDSNRADLAKELQDRCENLLLLTATPHSGNPEHFFNILNLIDPFMFAEASDLDRQDARQRIDKVMIRRGKETIFEINQQGELVKKFKDREPHPQAIEFTDDERQLYNEVSSFTGTEWSQLSRKQSISKSELNAGRFLLTLVQKRMVSSPAALRETLKRRIDSIVDERTATKTNAPEKQEIKRLLKSYERGDYLEEEDREFVERYIETRRIQASHAERTKEIKTLRALLEKVEKLMHSGEDSKYKWLREFLKKLFTSNPADKVIIFTEYRDTLNFLKAKLENEFFMNKEAIVVIHGGMPLGEDEDELGSKLYAERRFNEPDTRILLATDAASEGLNLQRYCHNLINYELPWNPNRLEQRIGRIHRYGQKYIAQIYNLMISGSKEAQIFTLLQEKIETIRRQLGNMAEVLGVLERISLDDLILRVLDKNIDEKSVGIIAEKELKKMDEIARQIQETQFLSGCREFSREDIGIMNGAIVQSEKAIPGAKDVQEFVKLFLRVFGDDGTGDKNGRILHPTNNRDIFRLIVPSVIRDDKLPSSYPRVTFSRLIATEDWSRNQQPDFLAFGHPLLERMVHYCRRVKASELSSQVACLRADYTGLPGIIFNFLLRFEDKRGRVIREELEPVFVDIEGTVQKEIGRRLFLDRTAPQKEAHCETLKNLIEKNKELQLQAEAHIRKQYLEYYERVEKSRNKDIEVLIEDMERFNKGRIQFLENALFQIIGSQMSLPDLETPAQKGQRTRIENQMRMHQQRMKERRQEIEQMRLGAFPAPELLNMVLLMPL
ncbi:MAG: SNF2-related protein [Candidatus Eremiobacteraeota bacterium]|nr:SNF2-related protein [Candidatus Eremiobacteraeota bacterium]